MPLFVDGVDISSVYNDGVELSNVFSDGVEVWSGMEEMFDDFERSPNGTSVYDHIMNTGQAWATQPFGGSTIPLINPFQGEQSAVHDPSGTSSAIDIRAVPTNVSKMSNAYVVSCWLGWEPTIQGNTAGAYMRVSRLPGSTGAFSESTYAQLWNQGQAGGQQIRLHNNGVEMGAINTATANLRTGVMTILIDMPLGLMEGRYLFGGVSYSTGVHAVTNLGDPIYEYDCNTTYNTAPFAGIKQFELIPYKSGSVPFT